MIATVLISLLVLVIILVIAFFSWAHFLPRNLNEVIAEAQEQPLPELVKGQVGWAQNGEIKIAYEHIRCGKDGAETVLLIMGHSSGMMRWPSYFIQQLLNDGLDVIRYDNRGLGLSDWIQNWSKESSYSLEDMAHDGVSVLNHLDVNRVHLIGMSMGGMIAQRISISHSNRVLTLASVMSTGFWADPKLVSVPFKWHMNFIRAVILYKSKLHLNEVKIKFGVAMQQMLFGKADYAFDLKGFVQTVLFEIEHRGGFNPRVGDQHSLAIVRSGSRYEELGEIAVPTVVIHGTDDTLIKVEHAKKYAPMIKNAELVLIEGMGHDLPLHFMPQIMAPIKKNMKRVEESI